MGMVPSGLKNEIRNKFSEVRSELSKPVVIFTSPQTQDCPNCLHDYTGASTGQFDSNFVTPVFIFGQVISPQPFSRISCPVCSGKGHLEYEASTVIKAIVRWNPTDELSRGDLQATSAGVEGRNVVRLKAAKCFYDVLRDATKATIDGIECVLHLPPVLRGVGDVDVLVTAYFIAADVGHNVRVP